jgi:hypothetical protein
VAKKINREDVLKVFHVQIKLRDEGQKVANEPKEVRFVQSWLSVLQ